MVYEVRLPEISENVESGRVATLLVQEGDTVAKDQDLVEMETDKAVLGIPSPRAGRVKEVVVAEGDEVKVGEVILRLEEVEEEDRPSTPEEPPAEEKNEEEVEEKQSPEREEEEEKETSSGKERGPEEKEPARTGDSPPRREEGPPARRGDPAPASPSVRRLARELGVHIDRVTGTGPRGRISREDVKAHAKALLHRHESVAPAPPPLPDLTRWGEVEREPMSKVRRITAQGMAAAWSSIPHVFQFEKADMEGLEEFRRRYARRIEAAGAAPAVPQK